MKKNDNTSSGPRLWKIAGGTILALGLVTVVMSVPDIKRLIRIYSM